ncbi:MAG: hypothetical protein KJZ84_03330 [Bryobacteraceae bacterium]|nr:hypothetical protein [Bryobacteraceae bacterium]
MSQSSTSDAGLSRWGGQPLTKTLFLVPDGVGVRNFLLDPFAQFVGQVLDPVVLAGFRPELLPEEARRWSPLPFLPFREGPVVALLRYALAYAHQYRWGSYAMLSNLARPVAGPFKVRLLHRVAKRVGRACGHAAGIKWLARLLEAENTRRREFREYQQLLRRLNPLVVFCTHQRPVSVVPIVLAAHSLGIPTVTFIYSWDNLSGQGRIPAPFDYYFVWSTLMKSELLRYYPDVRDNQVVITGTPQFDAYADTSLYVSREEFCRRVGADPARPLICYSGGDRTTCPNEPNQLALFLELARRGRFEGNPQILFRPSPADEGSRFDWVRERYPELIYARPRWRFAPNSNWVNNMPTQEDVTLLVNLARHANIGVNMASTMTMDFAVFDKPVVNIAYWSEDPANLQSTPWPKFYSYEHFKPVVDLRATLIADSAESLVDCVNAALADPGVCRDGRRQLLALQMDNPPGGASARQAEALIGIARRHAQAVRV